MFKCCEQYPDYPAIFLCSRTTSQLAIRMEEIASERHISVHSHVFELSGPLHAEEAAAALRGRSIQR